MSDAERQYRFDRWEGDGRNETEDWLERMREERAEAELEQMRAERAAAEKAAKDCCRSMRAGLGHHDYYCSANYSRSAGS